MFQHSADVASMSLHIASTSTSASTGASGSASQRIAVQLKLSTVAVLLATVWALLQHAAHTVLVRLLSLRGVPTPGAASLPATQEGGCAMQPSATQPPPLATTAGAALAPKAAAGSASAGLHAGLILRRRSPPPAAQQIAAGAGGTLKGTRAHHVPASSSSSSSSNNSAVQHEQHQRLVSRIPQQLPEHRGRLTIVLDLDETLLCTFRLVSCSSSSSSSSSSNRTCDSLQLVPSHRPPLVSSSSLASSSSSRLGRLPSSLSGLFRGRSTSDGSSDTAGCCGTYTISTRCSSGALASELGAAVGASAWMHYTPPPPPHAAAATGASSSCIVLGPHSLAVFERPGCREFLGQLAALGEVVLFTAAARQYAAPLADLLDPRGVVFRGRLYGDACVSLGGRRNVKDLEVLGRDVRRVVLVDNCLFSFLAQPCNGLPCLPFKGAPGDSQLLGVILPLLASLAQVQGDVRPLLDSMFSVRRWLASKGYDTPPPSPPVVAAGRPASAAGSVVPAAAVAQP